MGSLAIEGPVTAWVADHRKHHAFSDKEGDPHSPHVDHGVGVRGALAGLFHAHVGWLFIHTHRGAKTRYAPDLLADPVIRWVDRTFVLWVVTGLGMAFGLGWLIGGSLETALTGLLWGGGVRMLVVHHVTYSINSLCHFFGERRFPTGDESRNLLWLALPTFGESWHNNHHAFPTSAFHGLRRRDVDPSAMVIRGLERLGLVWDVVRVSPERQAQRAEAGAAVTRAIERDLRSALAAALPDRPFTVRSGTARSCPPPPAAAQPSPPFPHRRGAHPARTGPARPRAGVRVGGAAAR